MIPHVLKFGGSSFASEQHFHRVARHVKDLAAAGGKTALIVSGLPGATEELREKCFALNPAPSDEALDSLLPLADTVGATLLRAALEAWGVKATTLSGHELGMLTDSNASRARILAFDPAPLRDALGSHDVVVVPGGQGRSARGRQTWLGKNSSDLSAVAVAAALGAPRCEVFSDVAGIYSGDPGLLSGVQLLPELSYDVAITMARSGAKVIHPGSVAWAARHGVEIVCRLNHGDLQEGTRIGSSGRAAAVVLDLRSIVLELSTDAEGARASAALRSIEVPFVALPEHGPVLAVTCGFFDVELFLREKGILASPLERHLVTELRPDGSVIRHVPEKSAARELAQRLHDQLHAPSRWAVAREEMVS